MEDRYKALIAVVGIICLTAYGSYMAHLGVNSTLATAIIAGIGGIVGAILGVVIGAKKGTSTTP